MRILKTKVAKNKKIPKHMELPDIETVEEDREFPHSIEVKQAFGSGQRQRIYYSAESWAKHDLAQADMVELMFFERKSKKRFFYSYVLKAMFYGVGFFLTRRCKRYEHKMLSAMDSDLRDDYKLVGELWLKKYKHPMPQSLHGYVKAFFLLVTIDNAYNTFYKELKQEILSRKTICATSKTTKSS